jgi:predicted PurR-regulated permease PerM
MPQVRNRPSPPLRKQVSARTDPGQAGKPAAPGHPDAIPPASPGAAYADQAAGQVPPGGLETLRPVCHLFHDSAVPTEPDRPAQKEPMALPVRQQATYWGIAAVVLLVVLWGLGSVLLPFLLGGALAYFLDPVADRLQRAGLSRTAATATISVVALLVFVVLALLVIPTLVRQLADLVNAVPAIVARLQAFLSDRFPEFMASKAVVRDTLSGLAQTIQTQGAALAGSILSSALSVIGAVVFIVVVPVVAFYLLLDWDHMVAEVDALLPRDHAPVIRGIGREIDRVLAGFVRGQVSVCLILGSFYAIALMIAGLQFGLVVGAIAGLITFIPYVGALVGGALAIGLALFQFWGDWVQIGVVAGIFAVGQFLEGNIITPKLVGKSVGLHPVWLLFALSVFGALFGFVGMLVAVPVAAAIGVLARFAIARYRESRLYLGLDHDAGTKGRPPQVPPQVPPPAPSPATSALSQAAAPATSPASGRARGGAAGRAGRGAGR